MKMLGLDPGYGRLGYGVIEQRGFQLKPLEFGVFETPASAEFGLRLGGIHQAVCGLCRRHQPQEAAVEQVYFSKNVKTALLVAQARGVILLALQQCKVPVVEISPQHVKTALVGYGGAAKPQLQSMVQRLLGLKTLPEPDDAADALGLAISALRSRKIREYEKKLGAKKLALARLQKGVAR